MTEHKSFWRTEIANRARIIIDGADYFEILRKAMLRAKKRIILIGWDFDTRISLSKDEHEKGEPPVRLGEFIEWLANNRPDLEIKILKWQTSAIKLLGRGSTIITVAKWAIHDQIEFKLDNAHPAGCSHHQKIVVIDDNFAVCGGIDMTTDRWDTREHVGQDERRKRPNGSQYHPWHDVTMIVDGEAASALGDLARSRWSTAGGETLKPLNTDNDPWPEDIEPQFENVNIKIARTRAKYGEVDQIQEIEALFLEQIRGAQKFIYIENQYFTSRKIADAIALRLEEDDPPEIVLVMPATADGWLEHITMDSARAKMISAIRQKQNAHRFAVFTPVNEVGEDIYVHAKIMIIDDQIVRVGSANMNNRSLGLDSECDLVIDSREDGNQMAGSEIFKLRVSLIAEHCGTTERMTEKAMAAGQPMIDFIESRSASKRKLVRFEIPDLDMTEELLADNKLLDPERPEEFFEPFADRELVGKVARRSKPSD
ncbi:phospholipase D-like domain-containing protein [Parasphingorhabdus cellanae]|uniref:phospholipase D-like domain-containing protein n=1 Tax=Parasphingorhabdus cellanae TaxID=2806553 RepID=UPI001FB05288|nr:phospholipase D-like domain-containing protein [Parasphingorhabdus cellanae]